MSASQMKAGTALGLCLMLVPLAIVAQGNGVSEGAALFVAPVEACLIRLTADDCGPFQEAIIACAADIGVSGCGRLLRDPDVVLADPALRERAIAALAAAVEEFAAPPEVTLAPVEGEGAEVVPGPESSDPVAGEEMAMPGAGAEDPVEPVPEPVSEPVPEPVSDDLADAVSDAAGEAVMTGEEAPVVIEEVLSAEVPLAPVEERPDIAAEEASAIAELMAAPEVLAAVETLDRALDARDGGSDIPVAAGAGLAEAAEEEPAAVLEAEVAETRARASNEAFGSDFTFDVGGLGGGINLEEAGLAALAALVVGMSVEGERVVARSDERVIMQDDQGGYDIWRDDDAVLAQQGADRRIEQYDDGSTLTRWQLPDGAQVITVRDATGRVLLRERVLADGTRVRLIDDLREVEPVDVTLLPRPVAREVVVGEQTDPEAVLAILRAAEADARAVDRGFSLRQVRQIREVRELVPVLSGEPIIFESDRAEVRPEEARKLAQLGVLLEMLVAENRGEVFLIEGHTDATGPAAYNLGLSDRRAESVALALIELFDIPPENLVIQGYGEQHLRVPTLEAEAQNRRVTVRRITPLLVVGG
jgi:outer membrane protein OmpA-like peptidoglycan-associated protein